jgi:hypothetical protein
MQRSPVDDSHGISVAGKSKIKILPIVVELIDWQTGFYSAWIEPDVQYLDRGQG